MSVREQESTVSPDGVEKCTLLTMAQWLTHGCRRGHRALRPGQREVFVWQPSISWCSGRAYGPIRVVLCPTRWLLWFLTY